MTLAALYDWLLFAHVLAAMLWLGGATVMAVLAGRVLKSGDDAEVARFTGSLRAIGPVLFAPTPFSSRH